MVETFLEIILHIDVVFLLVNVDLKQVDVVEDSVGLLRKGRGEVEVVLATLHYEIHEHVRGQLFVFQFLDRPVAFLFEGLLN